MDNMSKEFIPFQPGDFVEIDDGKAEGYKGPLFNVTYPASVDPIMEEVAWNELGYRVKNSFSYNSNESFTLVVMGDIPEWAQEKFKYVGVSVSLSKPRGDLIKL